MTTIDTYPATRGQIQTYGARPLEAMALKSSYAPAALDAKVADIVADEADTAQRVVLAGVSWDAAASALRADDFTVPAVSDTIGSIVIYDAGTGAGAGDLVAVIQFTPELVSGDFPVILPGGEIATADAAGPPGGGGVVSVVAGTNVTVDDSDPANPVVSATGGPGGGVTVHNDLTGRDAADQHPMSAIDGLEAALAAAGGGGSVALVIDHTADTGTVNPDFGVVVWDEDLSASTATTVAVRIHGMEMVRLTGLPAPESGVLRTLMVTAASPGMFGVIALGVDDGGPAVISDSGPQWFLPLAAQALILRLEAVKYDGVWAWWIYRIAPDLVPDPMGDNEGKVPVVNDQGRYVLAKPVDQRLPNPGDGVTGDVLTIDGHGDWSPLPGGGAANDALVFKGVIDCSGSPDYPAADAGHTYRVSVAGRIGGGSGPKVEAGELLLCTVDSSAAGNQATVGANWVIGQTNLDGAVTGPASAVDLRVAVFDGTSGRLIKDGGVLLADLALDSGIVHNTGDEPVAGVKTFSSSPLAPTPAANDSSTKVATTGYVDTADGLLVPKALIDAKGDLLVGTADDTIARLAVGTTGQVLTADSASTPGVKWATPAAGGSYPQKPTSLSGRVLLPPFLNATSTPPLNQATTGPVWLVAGTIDAFVYMVSTAGSATVLPRVSIYSADSYLRSGPLMAEAIGPDASTTGIKTVLLPSPITITDGIYYPTYTSQGLGTVPTLRGRGVGVPVVPFTLWNGLPDFANSQPTNYQSNGISGSMPATWPQSELGSPGGQSGNTVLMGVRYA